LRVPETVECSAHGIAFTVRLTPRGGRDAVDGWGRAADGSAHLKLRVSAVPEDGKANVALIALLAKTLGVAKSGVSIVGGHTARLKRIEIDCDGPSLSARLMALGEAK
jgi:uncharacterized protein YggU (UPF0235/DUF167 family)